MDIQSYGALIRGWGPQFSCRVLDMAYDFSRYVQSLPLDDMNDGWTLDLWDEGPQTERVL